MENMLKKLSQQNFRYKIAVISSIFLGICLAFTIFTINDIADKFNKQTKELIETRTKLLNTQLEKFDFAEEQKKKLSKLDEDEKKEFLDESLNDIKNRFREVEYFTNDKGQIVIIDFSNLDISCDTYKRIALSFNKNSFPNANYINKNCDEVVK